MTDAVPALEATPTQPTAATIEQRPRKKNLDGAPVEIGGQTWYLANLGFSPGWTMQRDRLYEEIMLADSVFKSDINQCAYAMLVINYKQTEAEIMALIAAADRKELSQAVCDQILNLDLSAEQRGYTYYARTALRSAGLDPDAIPPEECAGVLHHLVASGRVASHDSFTKAGEYANMKKELLSLT